MRTPTLAPVDSHSAGEAAERGALHAGAGAWGGGPRRPQPITLEARPASPAAVALRWRDDRREAAAYGLLRREPGDHWRLVAVLAADQSRYADGGLRPGTRYEYAVCRFYDERAAAAPDGRWSNLATALTP